MSSASGRSVQCELCWRTVHIDFWSLVRHSLGHSLGVHSAFGLVWLCTGQLFSACVCYAALVGLGWSVTDAVTVVAITYLAALLYGGVSLAGHVMARHRRTGKPLPRHRRPRRTPVTPPGAPR